MTAAGISVAAGLAACGSPGAVATSQPTAPMAVVAPAAAAADALGINLDWPVARPAVETAPATTASESEVPYMTPPRAALAPPHEAPAGGSADEPSAPPAAPPASPDPAAAPVTAAAPLAMEASSGVVVRPGDSLWSIAADQLPDDATPARIDATWRAWYRANRDIIGPDPNLVMPGQVLYAPDEGTADAATGRQEAL
jgi:nucleoid-associated protein YgaU